MFQVPPLKTRWSLNRTAGFFYAWDSDLASESLFNNVEMQKNHSTQSDADPLCPSDSDGMRIGHQ